MWVIWRFCGILYEGLEHPQIFGVCDHKESHVWNQRNHMHSSFLCHSEFFHGRGCNSHSLAPWHATHLVFKLQLRSELSGGEEGSLPCSLYSDALSIEWSVSMTLRPQINQVEIPKDGTVWVYILNLTLEPGKSWTWGQKPLKTQVTMLGLPLLFPCLSFREDHSFLHGSRLAVV